VYDVDTCWELAPVDYARCTVIRKSVHIPEKYLEKITKDFGFLTSSERWYIIRSYRKFSSIWESIKGSRRYRINYRFVTRKLLELGDLPHLAHQVPPIKTRSTLAALDVIWKRVCYSANWTYIPSA
jgi:hypothetical protein